MCLVAKSCLGPLSWYTSRPVCCIIRKGRSYPLMIYIDKQRSKFERKDKNLGIRLAKYSSGKSKYLIEVSYIVWPWPNLLFYDWLLYNTGLWCWKQLFCHIQMRKFFYLRLSISACDLAFFVASMFVYVPT